MDEHPRQDIREFLVARRGRLTPTDVGLPVGARRRVTGLRREEVAVLAGVSTDWYTRLEKGHIAGVSDEVLDAVAHALRLDEAERSYLRNLASAARSVRGQPRRRPQSGVPQRVQWMLDSMLGSAAIVANGRLDIVAANSLGRALYAPVFAHEGPSIARFQFLDPVARDFYPEWGEATRVTAALLRTEAGRDPHDAGLRELVGELSTLSEDFRVCWAAHEVRLHRAGVKRFQHLEAGPLDLTYHTMDISERRDQSLALTVYTAEPGSESEERLRLLASWAMTQSEV